jgi:hypothetical protein
VKQIEASVGESYFLSVVASFDDDCLDLLKAFELPRHTQWVT